MKIRCPDAPLIKGESVSKIIRTVRISGQAVTLGEAERDLYLKEEQSPEADTIDLTGLLEARVTAMHRQLEEEWQGRLQREKQELQAAADQRLQEAQERWDAEREQLHQQRYEEGHQAGLDAREAEAREAVERLDVLHQAFEGERAQLLREAEGLVVDLAVALARRVTGIQAEIDHKVLLRVIRSALEHLSEHSNLEIKVHPEDLQVARRFASRWVEKVAREAIIKVVPSDHVTRGGCMIEGLEENVDARLEGQLESLQQALHTALDGENKTVSGEGLEAQTETGEESSGNES